MSDAPATAPTDERDPALVDAEQWGTDPDWSAARDLTAQITEAEARVEQLREDRRGRYRALIAKGATRATLGRLAGVSPMAIKFELDPSSRTEVKRRKGAGGRRTKTVAAPGGE